MSLPDKKTEEQLAFQAKLLEKVNDAISATDENYTITYWNKAAEKLFGWKAQDVVGKSSKEIFQTKVPESSREKAIEKMLNQDFYEGEVYYKNKKGAYILTFVRSTVLRGSKGEFKGTITSFTNITERKKAEEALKESEERLKMAQQVAHVGTFEWNIQTGVNTWTPELEAMYGIPTGSFPGTQDAWEQLVYYEDRSEAVRRVSEAIKNGSFEAEFRVAWPDGSIHWMLGRGWVLKDATGKPLRLIGINLDITDRKKVEESLKRQAALIELSPDAIIVKTLEGKITFWSKGSEKLYGYTKDEALGQISHELLRTIYPVSKTKIQSEIKRYGEWCGELRHKTKAKKDVIVQSRWITRAESSGELSILESNKDITQQKEAEQQLEEYTKNLEGLVEERTLKLEAAARYARSLIEASLDPLVTISAGGKITDANQATEFATGCCRKELIGSVFSSYFTEPDKAEAGYEQVFTEGFVRDYPLAIRHKSGKTMDVLYNATVLKNSEGGVLGVFAAARDVTERKKLEKKLHDSERLAAIGATAGMVGHDIRNPLQAITGDLYLAKAELSELPDSEQKISSIESLDGIQLNIEYINKIVQDLQDFAKTLTPRAREVDIQSIVSNVLASHRIPENITVKVNVDKQTRLIIADSDFIKRIADNLILNAIQAMPNGGKLSIETKKEKQTGDIIFTVEDTGVGIPENVKDKLFTPMFTTKSKGQGFGLAVAKRMTEALGGTVTFESEHENGTKFVVRLPKKK